MAAPDYDLLTVGGGIGGGAIAKAMAEQGARVLVVEREQRFVDRVRGELLMSWGVAEACKLGLEERLLATCAHPLPWNDLFVSGMHVARRDLPGTTTTGTPWFAFYHPVMQETVLAVAQAAGAEVRRGARVRGVQPGDPARVTVEADGETSVVTARLVVGVDGRSSAVRNWCGFAVERDPQCLLFSGVLFDDMAGDADTSSIFFSPNGGRISLLFPQGRGRVRAYVGYHHDADPPHGRENDLDRFVSESIRVGVDAAWYAGARAAGPLAMFEGADNWVPHPYRDGVALIGDAAATSDPTWGQGMSLTLRDVRTLRDCLLASDDWSAAGHAYAEEHDRYHHVIHTVDGWFTSLFMEVDGAAQERRARAFPLLAQDPTRLPEAPVSGPECGANEHTRRRFFGEE